MVCGGCGKVQALADAGGDGVGIANGSSCTVGTECTSGECACSNASCTAKVCSPIACACGFDTTGDGTCDGYVAAGTNDGADSCGASACDGTGACGLPLLWFKFDEPANTGTVTNSGTWPGTVMSVAGTQGMAGQVGSAIKLAAVTDGVVIADPTDDSLDGFASWTIEGWIHMTTLPVDGYATLLKKEFAYVCRIVEGGGCTNCYTGQGIAYVSGEQSTNWTMTPEPKTNTWYHMACTYAAGTLKVYWNGVPRRISVGVATTLDNSASNLGIGNDPGSGENAQGLLDDFKMWSTARTDRQICIDACGSYTGSTCTFDGICGN